MKPGQPGVKIICPGLIARAEKARASPGSPGWYSPGWKPYQLPGAEIVIPNSYALTHKGSGFVLGKILGGHRVSVVSDLMQVRF